MTTYVSHILHRINPQSPQLVDAYAYLKDALKAQFQDLSRYRLLHVLHRMAEMGIPTEYAYFLSLWELQDKPPNPYETLLLTRIQQLQGMEYDPQAVMKNAHETPTQELYWGSTSWRWYGGLVEQSTLAYQILNDHGDHEPQLAAMRRYFFKHRDAFGWGNTIESAQTLAWLMPQLIEQVQNSGSVTLEIQQGYSTYQATEFPFSQKLEPDQSLILRKNGKLPLFVSIFQQEHQSTPQAVDSLFSLTTRFMQDGKTNPHLQVGKPVQLHIEVVVHRSASYMQLDIPIPAGCDYADTHSSHDLESHREKRKDQTTIYLEHLPKGKHTFTVALNPRFSGEYVLNPAHIEDMYQPTNSGNNEVKEIRIAPYSKNE